MKFKKKILRDTPLAMVCILFVLIIPVLSESCRSKETAPQDTGPETEAVDTLPPDFVTFFNRFHEDSAFQWDHIIFPLEGLPNSTGDGDTTANARFFWQKSEWVKHNRFTDPGGNFDHWYTIIGDRIIEHWIQMKGTNMYMKRRFAKLDDGWYLIYYQGMRPVTTEG
jgi:hypothetical protein